MTSDLSLESCRGSLLAGLSHDKGRGQAASMDRRGSRHSAAIALAADLCCLGHMHFIMSAPLPRNARESVPYSMQIGGEATILSADQNLQETIGSSEK